jgi:hypothetical protein
MENQKHQYLTEREVSALTRISLQTLRNERCKGKGIPYVKLGTSRRSSVRYCLEDVLAFMESHRVVPPEV